MSSSPVRRTRVPQEMDGGKEFARSAYSSAFELSAANVASLTPEQWARAVFEGAPAVVRWILLLGWRRVLGLRLRLSSPESVLGWSVADRGPGTLTLEAHSRLIGARNVVLVREGSVVWVTFVRFNRPIARPIWGLAAPVHHAVIPWLLRRGLPKTP
ncbi:DUF2867 domain-containing protein [Streptomyces sp. NPDC053079]|uniref:DUF2867 domain-containing protein n=1 Tax=Streptomyces sp. NPDC053079 TaxID=3365697 RepID=UPI0037D24311